MFLSLLGYFLKFHYKYLLCVYYWPNLHFVVLELHSLLGISNKTT